jgi:hypothetical protein
VGIFGDIGGAIGEALPGLLQTGGQLLLQKYLQPEPRVQVMYGAGPPGVGYAPAISPATFPGSIPLERPVSMPPLPTTPAYEIPSEIEWGLDPAGTLAGQLFKKVKEGRRAVPYITAKNPATGQVVFWEHAGRPVLFSRDLRVCRRVGKIAARAARGRARRRVTRKR